MLFYSAKIEETSAYSNPDPRLDRQLEIGVAWKFLAELMDQKELRALLSHDYFSVDGTQVVAWASMKSKFQPTAIWIKRKDRLVQK